MIAVARSHIGHVRSVNQDSHEVHMDLPFPHVILADGMGGHNAGEVASSMAVKVVHEFFIQLDASLREDQMTDRITQSYKLANQRIYQNALEEPSRAGMGTTLIVSVLQPDKFWIGHVFHNEMLTQITEDHTLVYELVRKGQISLAEAEQHPQRHYLTRAVGTEKDIEVDIRELNWETNDILLLCSDGLTSYVSSMEIESILKKNKPLDEKVSILLELALVRGGHDNITIVAVLNSPSSRGDVK
jgi:PPM family protein phosphatase